jgi:zinc protease
LERLFGEWRSGASKPVAGQFARPPAAKPTRILLVDKPGAAQSVIALGQIGAERKSPDFYALTVMNSIFGGQFSSRLNLNLREAKGYTYGARSKFDWRTQQPGPFVAMASVETASTAEALVEFIKEYRGMLGALPITTAELEFAKAYLARSYPANFETPGQMALHLETLVQYGLPEEFFNTYVSRVKAVTAEDLAGVAKRRLDPDHLTIVVVADRTRVEASLRSLPVGKNIEVLRFDEEFRLLPAH